MRVKNILHEDFTNYREPCMFIGCISCGGKCCIEQNLPLSICQNDELRNAPIYDIPNDVIIKRYIENPITNAICWGGLEPFEQWDEIKTFIAEFRKQSQDTIILYTGYNEDEITKQTDWLKQYPNIIIKFGRYIPGQSSHKDPMLGVMLASDNQYSRRIS